MSLNSHLPLNGLQTINSQMGLGEIAKYSQLMIEFSTHWLVLWLWNIGISILKSLSKEWLSLTKTSPNSNMRMLSTCLLALRLLSLLYSNLLKNLTYKSQPTPPSCKRLTTKGTSSWPGITTPTITPQILNTLHSSFCNTKKSIYLIVVTQLDRLQKDEHNHHQIMYICNICK